MKISEFKLTILRIVVVSAQFYVFYRLKISLSAESFGTLVQQIYLMLIAASLLRFGFAGFSQTFDGCFSVEKLAFKYASIIFTNAIIVQIFLLPIMIYLPTYAIIFLFGVIAANITFSLLKRLEGNFISMILLDYNINYVVIALLCLIFPFTKLSFEFVFKTIFLCEFLKILYLFKYYRSQLFTQSHRSFKVFLCMINNRRKRLFLYNDVLSILSQNGIFALLPVLTGAAIAGQYFWITRFVFPLQFWQQTLNTIWVNKLRAKSSPEVGLKLYLTGIFAYSSRGIVLSVFILTMCYYFQDLLLIADNLLALAFLILFTLPSLVSGPSGPFLNKLDLPDRLVSANLLYLLIAVTSLIAISWQIAELWQVVLVLGSANLIKNLILIGSVMKRLQYDKYI